MNFSAEIWRPVRGYERLYEVSSKGNIRSLDRLVDGVNHSHRLIKGKSLKPGDTRGYLRVVLCNNGNSRNWSVHLLVWDAFGSNPRNGRLLQVDHIDDNKKNNGIINLQLLNPQQNASKSAPLPSSGFRGVYKSHNGWQAKIRRNGNVIHLGTYLRPEQAVNRILTEKYKT